MTRVLQWNSARCLGGAEFRTLELTECFLAKGYEVFIVCRKNSLLEQKIIQKKLCYINFVTYLDEFFKTLSFVIKWKPKIIHVHTGRDYNIALIIGLLTSTPVIIHRRLMSKVSLITSFFIKISKRAKIIAISNKVKDVLIKENNFKEDKIEVIYNAIPKERLKVNLKKVEEFEKIFDKKNKKIIVSVGNLYPTKGFDELIKVSKVLKNKIENLLVLIVGEGKEKEKLNNLIELYELQSTVYLLGRRDDVPELLTISDCFVLLSYEEPFGVAFIEALGCGKPVVGYKAGGVPEVIADGKVGFLVSPHDINSVVEKIYMILTDKNLYEKLSFNARSYFLERFDFKKMVSNIENLYFRTINIH